MQRLELDWLAAGFAEICGPCGEDQALAVDAIAKETVYNRAAREALVRRAAKAYPYRLEDAAGVVNAWPVYGPSDETAFIVMGAERALWRFKAIPAPVETPRRAGGRKRRRRTVVPKTEPKEEKEEE